MNLYFAGSRKNRCVHAGVTRVDGTNALFHVRFAQARDTQFAVEHSYTRNPLLQPRKNLFDKKRFQFSRWPGKKRDHPSIVFEPQSGGGAARIFQNFRAFWHHGLAKIHGGHVAPEAAEAGFDGANDFIVAAQFAAKEVGNRFARQVVFRGAQAAAGDHHGYAIQRIAKGFGQKFAVVADNGLAQNLDAKLIQLFGQEKGIGVQAIRRQQFRANRDDFRFHAQYCSSPLAFITQAEKSPSCFPILSRRSHNAQILPCYRKEKRLRGVQDQISNLQTARGDHQ